MSIVNDCNGIYRNEEHPNLTMLLYADDLVIIGDHVGRVQQLLNVLSQFCNKWGLKVNLEKTKAVICRNGGIVSKHEKFYLDGRLIACVPYYKYLGLMMSSRLSWSPAQLTLSLQAQKALHLINHVDTKCDFFFKTSFILFDKCITPILMYGSEIWGLNMHKSIETFHVKFCRKIIGVGSKTPSVAVLGECGRHQIFILCYVKCIKYWLHILTQPNTSLVRSCYNILYDLSLLGKENWVSKVKNVLCMYGFTYVWENQGVENVDLFIKLFKQRLQDCDAQNWSLLKSNTPK